MWIVSAKSSYAGSLQTALYVGSGRCPPQYPTTVRATPGSAASAASGCQNQDMANVAMAIPGSGVYVRSTERCSALLDSSASGSSVRFTSAAESTYVAMSSISRQVREMRRVGGWRRAAHTRTLGNLRNLFELWCESVKR